jgi:hypothetical protein
MIERLSPDVSQRRSHRLAALVALALPVALGLPACSIVKGDSSKGSLIFSHEKHADSASCSDCHKGVEASTGATAGRFIPAKPECSACHEDDLKSACPKCHRGAKEGITFVREDRGLSFSHAAHAPRVKECSSCHGDEKKGERTIPGHKTCGTAGCHKSAFKALSCKKCHRDLQHRRVMPQAVFTHGVGFEKNHGSLARQGGEACAQCHDQTFCAECHGATSAAKPSILFPEQVERGFIHRGDFLTRHTLEARADPASCRKCHGQRHCRSCHALAGLAETVDDRLTGGRSRKKHPAGWMTQGSDDFHGFKARQDIGACASCHDRGALSNCVGCHRVGGTGGNPHPAGWTWRDKGGQCRSNSMCATCHPGGQGCR